MSKGVETKGWDTGAVSESVFNRWAMVGGWRKPLSVTSSFVMPFGSVCCVHACDRRTPVRRVWICGWRDFFSSCSQHCQNLFTPFVAQMSGDEMLI